MVWHGGSDLSRAGRVDMSITCGAGSIGGLGEICIDREGLQIHTHTHIYIYIDMHIYIYAN